MGIRVAVLTLTWNRLPLTKICLESMWDKNRDFEWDHFVWDNGSSDGTREWLSEPDVAKNIHTAHLHNGNAAIRGPYNTFLDRVQQDYDVAIKIDNDCLCKTEGSIQLVAETIMAATKPLLLSPLVDGLGKPRRPIEFFHVGETEVGRMGIGGIFMAGATKHLAGYRAPLDLPLRGHDYIINLWAGNGGWDRGYLSGHFVEHYRGTAWQVKNFKSYFDESNKIRNKRVDIGKLSWNEEECGCHAGH